MAHFTQLPPEILHSILSHIDPADLAAVPLACRAFYYFVHGNATLCQEVYLRHLDEPLSTKRDWERELHDLVRLQRLCASRDPDKRSELAFVHETVLWLLANSARSGQRASHSRTYPQSRNVELLAVLFGDESTREAFLCRSFLFERARGLTNRFQDPPKPEHQQSAQLHCLYGIPVLRFGRTRAGNMAPLACSKVYDLRQYSEQSRWGPFMNDGSDRVDWERVEAIMLVLFNNMREKGLDKFPVFANFWDSPFAGTWAGSYLPMPVNRELTPIEMEDPYDVAGTWLRVVCFLDYNDFFSYNFPSGDGLPDNVPRPALDIGEATRLLLMKVHVTEIEPPGEEDGKELPVVHFRGFSRSLDGSWDENANSDLRGVCRMTPEGEVRWTTFSIYGGQERWRSEGIQLGGPRSAKGVVGNWFDKDYDPHGPCGPTAYWKLSDREPNSDDHKVLLNDFLPIVDGYEDVDEEIFEVADDDYHDDEDDDDNDDDDGR